VGTFLGSNFLKLFLNLFGIWEKRRISNFPRTKFQKGLFKGKDKKKRPGCPKLGVLIPLWKGRKGYLIGLVGKHHLLGVGIAGTQQRKGGKFPLSKLEGPPVLELSPKTPVRGGVIPRTPIFYPSF